MVKITNELHEKFSEWYRNEYKDVKQSLDVQAERIIETAIKNDYTDDDGNYLAFIYDLIGGGLNAFLSADAFVAMTLGHEATEGLENEEKIELAEKIMERISACLNTESELVKRRKGKYAVDWDEDGAISVFYIEKGAEA